MKPTQQEYWADVRTIAHSALDDAEWSDGEAALDENGDVDWGVVCDRITESVDGSQWVIYTYRAQLVLQFSSNDNAGPDECGWFAFTEGCTGWSDLFSRGAFYAMVWDVNEAIETITNN